MKLALCQIDPRVGDAAGNGARIAAAIREAHGAGADLAVFPELALTGYPPRDLLGREEFVRRVLRETQRLTQVAPELPVVVGTIARVAAQGGATRASLHNVAAVLWKGRVHAQFAKALLPVADVFEEPRFFAPGEASTPIEIAGRRVGVVVCEDLWDEGYARSPAGELVEAGADLVVAINASPYRVGVVKERLARARRPGVDLVYVNMVGAQDDLIFDGSSFVVNAAGEVIGALPPCEERVGIVDLQSATRAGVNPAPTCGVGAVELREATLREALVHGLSGFMRKNGMRRAVVGLSGGIDSALVLCLAADALGPGNVQAIQLPSRFTSQRSLDDSRALCANLGVDLAELELESLHAAAEITLRGALGDEPRGTTLENVQARLRGLLLMAWLNHHGGVLLNTSNKTELALGYGTLYGDLAGGLGVIADLNKPQVYALAREAYGGVIPSSILERAPSAELAEDQVDPFDYERIAPFLDLLVAGASLTDVRNAGASREEVAWLERRLAVAEFKRHQAPPGLKVSWCAFGQGRRMPLSHGFRRVDRPAAAPPAAAPREQRAPVGTR